MITMALAISTVLACTPGKGGVLLDSSQTEWVNDAWSRSVRPTLGDELGLRWEGGKWDVDSGRSDVSDLAASAYFAQPLLDAGINLAISRCDRTLLDELAEYYLAAFQRFETFGALARTRGFHFGKTYPYDLVGDPATRTLPWIHPAAGRTPARSAECLLCLSQFLHPAARLVRLLAALPLGARNQAELQFIHAYVPLITRDQVLRFAYDAPIDLGLPGGPSHGAVEGWRILVSLPAAERTLLPSGLLDVHLWFLSEAAEILAAHGVAPTLVTLSASDSAKLRDFLALGMRRLEQSATIRTVARDSVGGAIQGMDFFEGEFARHRDYAYAGDSSSTFPGPADTARVDSISWDISHAIRFPMILRSFRDTRRITGETFPTDIDLAAVAHQLSYGAFAGSMERPMFHNFMDGHDGWYRPGYAGRGKWGWPPSEYCDGRDPSRGCLGAGILAQWGLLASADPRLREIASRLIALASAHDSVSLAFRDRYYFLDGPLSFDTVPGKHPSMQLFELLVDFSAPAVEWAIAARPN